MKKHRHFLIITICIIFLGQVPAMATSFAKPQIIEPEFQQHNIAIKQIASDQRFVGTWRDYSSESSGQNDVIPFSEYKFGANGTFKFKSGSRFKSGKYQVIDNTLKYIYSNGSIESYTFKLTKDGELKILTLTQGNHSHQYSYMGLGHR